MKHRYVGEVNDYREYGLLRCLLGSGQLSTLVAWMLTPYDGGLTASVVTAMTPRMGYPRA